MRSGYARALVVATLSLWLAGCSTMNNLSDALSKPPTLPAVSELAEAPPAADGEPTGSVPDPLAPQGDATKPGLLGSDPYDDLSLGKKHYRANNFGLAEKHFRKAAELHPRDAEAWLGLAASYDRLRRFDLADRAYGQAVAILGPTVEILNNQGYSYMLRGDYKKARQKLLAAQRKDPRNKFVANNLVLLEESYRKGKAVE